MLTLALLLPSAYTTDGHASHGLSAVYGLDSMTNNANYGDGAMPLDQCMTGLPQNLGILSTLPSDALASSSDAAQALLSKWVEYAQANSQQCFNVTAHLPDPEMEIRDGGLLVSERWKFSYKTAAKVASNTARSYFDCRFGIPTTQKGVATLPDYLRLMTVREPLGRSVSGFFQIVMHYLTFLRVSPTMLKSCIAAWPENLKFLSDDKDILKENGGKWPHDCWKAWGVDPYKGTPMTRAAVFTKAELQATSESSLLAALWELPDGCRHLDKVGPVNTFCDGDNHTCFENCEVDDATMAKLYAHGLSDVAKSKMIGCEDNRFGAEHMWPVMTHIRAAVRADLVMKLETINDDTVSFEEYIQQQPGRPSDPKLRSQDPECNFDALHKNEGPDNHGLDMHLENTAQLKDVISRSPDLQQRICALYYHDYVCSAYALPEHCKGDPSTWLDKAMKDLLNDEPPAALHAKAAAAKSVAASGSVPSTDAVARLRPFMSESEEAELLLEVFGTSHWALQEHPEADAGSE